MTFSQKQKQIAKTLASFAPEYQNKILKLGNFEEQFKNTSDGNYIALEFFLDHFAYTRNVSPKAYPVIAKQTIENVFHGKLESIKSDQPSEAWRIYGEIATKDFNSIKTNATHNPMNGDKGVLAIMAQKPEDLNIANYVKKQINDKINDKHTKEAHKFIDSIRGIGTKIASFYLRDIAYLAGLEKKGINDPFLLQPMDTWLEQTYIIMDGEKSANREKKQNFFVAVCLEAGCSPIEFNQGAWYAGSQIAGGNKEKFKKIALGARALSFSEAS